MSQRFDAKKQDILSRLSKPDDHYEDASPKGSVDEGVRHLVNEINKTPGFVTTSSCSGRVAVFLEGPPKDRTSGVASNNIDRPNDVDEDSIVVSSTGGKGGGQWLFTSHEQVDLEPYHVNGVLFLKLGFSSTSDVSYPPSAERTQYVHFKFEPMILHILTESVKHAQLALNAALAAGFRESGISGILDSKHQPSNPMVAVRSSGLGMDSIIGFRTSDGGTDRINPMVSESYLRTLIQVANERFHVNARRMERFRQAFLEQVGRCSLPDRDAFEPTDVRKERKRKEGLLRQKAIHDNQNQSDASTNGQSDLESLDLDLLAA